MFLQEMEYYKDELMEIIYLRKMEHYWPLHNHPLEYQIVLVFSGTLLLEFEHNHATLLRDEFLIIPPYQTHIERSDGPISVLCLSVNKEAVENDGAKVLNLIDDIVEKLQQRGLVETRHIISLSRAASQILYTYRSQQDECAEFVAAAREMLEQRPEKQITLEEMAELVMVCRGYLARTFKRDVGLTPRQFQIQNRVRMATRLLIDTDAPIDDIGHKSGFYDISHFKRHFRRLLGMTPYAYRKAFNSANRII